MLERTQSPRSTTDLRTPPAERRFSLRQARRPVQCGLLRDWLVDHNTKQRDAQPGDYAASTAAESSVCGGRRTEARAIGVRSVSSCTCAARRAVGEVGRAGPAGSGWLVAAGIGVRQRRRAAELDPAAFPHI